MSASPQEPLSKDVTLSNGLNMRYYQWPGEGPNLIFLHPSSGYGRMWDQTAPHLSGRMQVFALDQRGHGDTGRPDGSYTAEEYAQDLHLFITQLGLEKAIVAGHSLGGRVAQVFAAEHPEQAQSIILVGGPHYSNFFQQRHRADAVLQGAERMRASQTRFASEDEALSYFKAYRPTDSDDALRHRIRHNCRPLPNGAVETSYDNVRVAQGLAHMADDLAVYAARVRCPVAIIRGAGSTHLTQEEAHRLAAFWKDAWVMDVDGDYTLEVENPEGLALAILDFCQATVSA